MVLGQSAATAAALALDAGVAVQDVPYARLRERLLKDGQVLERPLRRAARGVKGQGTKGEGDSDVARIEASPASPLSLLP